MKKVLSLLVAYIFLQTQIWAIGGGPSSGGTSAAALVGTYAGALLPSSASTGTQFNGLGLFTLGLPQTGIGSGNFVYFSEGKTFTGTIIGLADPKKQQFVGLVKAQFDIILASVTSNDSFFGNFSSQFTTPGGFANGTIKAKFKPGGTPLVSATGGGAVAGLRMTGQAKLDISELTTKRTPNDNGTPNDTTDDTTTTTTTVTTTSSLTLVVDGFQQSTSATTTTATGG